MFSFSLYEISLSFFSSIMMSESFSCFSHIRQDKIHSVLDNMKLDESSRVAASPGPRLHYMQPDEHSRERERESRTYYDASARLETTREFDKNKSTKNGIMLLHASAHFFLPASPSEATAKPKGKSGKKEAIW